jgi:hypothetical protein
MSVFYLVPTSRDSAKWEAVDSFDSIRVEP